MAKTKTQGEKRAELLRSVDELDLNRVQAVREIFERPEVQKAYEDLQALLDPSDSAVLDRIPTTDVNAFIGNMVVPFAEVSRYCTFHENVLNARLNPPEQPDTRITPLPGLPSPSSPTATPPSE